MARRAASTSGFPDEPGASSRPTSLRPYRLASGGWVLLTPGDAVPSGAIAGGLLAVSGAGLGLLQGTTGRRLVRVDVTDGIRIL